MRKGSVYILLIVLTVLSNSAFCNDSHLVRPGDTIYAISREYSVSEDLLLTVNGITDPGSLSVGTSLVIPASVYIVQPGDNLFRISRVTGVRVADLIAINNLDENGTIHPGTSLILGSPSETAPQAQTGPGLPSPGTHTGSVIWPSNGRRQPMSGVLEGVFFLASRGETITSVSSGQVVYVGPFRNFNKLVIVQGPDDLLYSYAGNETVDVRVGEQVFPGTVIGRVGINPHENKALAYFCVYDSNGNALDPETAPRI